jgi:putative two-component system response regulator
MNQATSTISRPDSLMPDQTTIRVMDDTPDNLTLMSSLLRDDYSVKIANSGAKALKIA